MSQKPQRATTDHQSPSISNLPQEAIIKFIDNQTRELEIRAQELALQKHQEDHHFEFSTKAIEAQLKDREQNRAHRKTLQRNTYILCGGMCLLVFGLIAYSLYLNKENVAMELIKMIVYVTAGGVGGYGFQRRKPDDDAPRSKPEKE